MKLSQGRKVALEEGNTLPSLASYFKKCQPREASEGHIVKSDDTCAERLEAAEGGQRAEIFLAGLFKASSGQTSYVGKAFQAAVRLQRSLDNYYDQLESIASCPEAGTQIMQENGS